VVLILFLLTVFLVVVICILPTGEDSQAEIVQTTVEQEAPVEALESAPLQALESAPFRKAFEAAGRLGEARRLAGEGRADEALVICDDVVDRFSGGAKVAAMRQQIIVLDRLNRPEIREQVADKVRWEGTDNEEAEIVLDAIFHELDRNTEPGQRAAANNILLYDALGDMMGNGRNPLTARYLGHAPDQGVEAMLARHRMSTAQEHLRALADSAGGGPGERKAAAKAGVYVAGMESIRMGDRHERWTLIGFSEQLARRIESDPDPLVSGMGAMFLVYQGDIVRAKNTANAVAYYNDAIRKFGTRDDPETRYWVGRARIGELAAIQKEGKTDIVPLIRDAAKWFSTDTSPRMRTMLASLLVKARATLQARGEREASVAMDDEIIATWRDGDPDEMRMNAVFASVDKAGYLDEEDRNEEALAMYNQIIERFGKDVQHKTLFSDSSTGVNAVVVEMFFRKAELLNRMERKKEAVAAYQRYLALAESSHFDKYAPRARKALTAIGVKSSNRD
jgi:tetratricopeptide (TPR) repeat protein